MGGQGRKAVGSALGAERGEILDGWRLSVMSEWTAAVQVLYRLPASHIRNQHTKKDTLVVE